MAQIFKSQSTHPFSPASQSSPSSTRNPAAESLHRLSRTGSRILLALLPLFAARCATVAHGTTQRNEVESNPPGADVALSCVQGSIPNVGSTPVAVEVQRKSKSCALAIAKDGYIPVTVPLHRTFSGAYVGNLLVGGVVGLVADAASGAMYKQGPSVVRVDLTARSAPPVVTVPVPGDQPAPTAISQAEPQPPAPQVAAAPEPEPQAEPPAAANVDPEPQVPPPAIASAAPLEPQPGPERHILMDRRGRDIAWMASNERELASCTRLGSYDVRQVGSERPEGVADEVLRVGGDTVFRPDGGTRFDIYRCGSPSEP